VTPRRAAHATDTSYYATRCADCGGRIRHDANVRVLDVDEGHDPIRGRWITAVIAHRRCPIVLTRRGRRIRDFLLAATAASTVLALGQLLWWLR